MRLTRCFIVGLRSFSCRARNNVECSPVTYSAGHCDIKLLPIDCLWFRKFHQYLIDKFRIEKIIQDNMGSKALHWHSPNAPFSSHLACAAAEEMTPFAGSYCRQEGWDFSDPRISRTAEARMVRRII
jgi:hypothetical protein